MPSVLVAANAQADLTKFCEQSQWESVLRALGDAPDLSKISRAALEACVNHALANDQFGILNFFLNLKPKSISLISRQSVATAIIQGNIESLKAAIHAGLDLSVTEKRENYLHVLAQSRVNGVELTNLLLIEGRVASEEALIDLEQRSKVNGTTPLGEALKADAYDVAQILIDAGASLMRAVYVEPYEDGYTILTPRIGQDKIIRAWFDKNGYKEVKRLLKSEDYTNAHKKGFIKFLSDYLPEVKKRTLERIWNNYEYTLLGQLLDQLESSSEEEEYQQRTICLSLCDDKEDKQYVDLANCGHRICRDCALFTIQNATENKDQALICPAKDCNRHIDLEKLADFDIKPSALVELKIRETERLLSECPKFSHCHRPDCHGGAINPKKKTHITCFVCECSHCTKCGLMHPKHACDTFLNDKFIKQQMKKELIKKCPNCKVNIEKNDGCNHMTCKKCGYQFDWLTLKRWAR